MALKGEYLERWVDHEESVPMDGNDLYKRTLGSKLILYLCPFIHEEDTVILLSEGHVNMVPSWKHSESLPFLDLLEF
jgi:hypothetical protein